MEVLGEKKFNIETVLKAAPLFAKLRQITNFIVDNERYLNFQFSTEVYTVNQHTSSCCTFPICNASGINAATITDLFYLRTSTRAFVIMCCIHSLGRCLSAIYIMLKSWMFTTSEGDVHWILWSHLNAVCVYFPGSLSHIAVVKLLWPSRHPELFNHFQLHFRASVKARQDCGQRCCLNFEQV